MLASVYNGVTDTDGVHVSMETVIQRIVTGERGLAEKTSHLNHLYQHDFDAYDREKVDLPAVTWSGTFPAGQRKAESLIDHSGYIVLDIDNDIDLDKVRSDLKVHPNVAFAFISPSGTGIKPVVRVDPVPQNAAEHKAAFDAVLAVFSEYAEQDPTKLPAQRDPNRLCFLAHDPTAVDRRDTASPVEWTIPVESSGQLEVPELDTSPAPAFEGKPDPKALDFIPNDCDYPIWRTVGMAIKDAGLGLSVFEKWTGGGRQRSNGEWTTEDIPAHWARYNSDGITWGSVVRLAKENGYKPPPPPDSVGESPYFYRSRFIPMAMMDALDADFSFLALPTEKHLRVYKNGVYTLDSDSELPREIHNRLGSRLQARNVTETLELLRQRHMLPLSGDGQTPCCHPDVVNLRNGLYNVREGELTPHSPTFKSIVQLPVSHDVDAKCPQIDAFLSDVLRDAVEVSLAHEMIGYSMLMQLPIAKLFVLLGPTHTGKSTFLDVLTAFLGAENTSGVSLQALDDDTQRFARSGLYGKLANIAADLSSRSLAGDSKVKMIAAGDRFDVERKGVDSFPMRPVATLICAANEMPRSRDRSDAWLERITILPFANQHKGAAAERGLIRKLTTPSELSGLFNHAIVAVARVLSAGVFTEGAKVIEARENYGLMNDHVLRFLTENFLRQDDSSFKDDVPKRLVESDVYDLYKKWCDDEGILKPTVKTNFRDSVEKWTGEKRVRTREGGMGADAARSFAFQKLILIEDSGSSSDASEPSGVTPPSDDAIPF